jgi:branched-chain amino acid transport system permease protein
LAGPERCSGRWAAAFILLEEFFWANFLDYNRAILGAVIVILIFFLPGGLLKVPYRRMLSRIFGHWQRSKALVWRI